jgi:hypothetical protein
MDTTTTTAPAPVASATAQAATAQVTSTLHPILAALFGPALNTFFTNAEAQQTVGGVAAQAPALVANIIAAVPSSEGALIKAAMQTAQAAVDHSLGLAAAQQPPQPSTASTAG